MNLAELLRQIPEPPESPTVAEMLAAVREVDPSARLGALLHDEAEILCAPEKAQACADAVTALILKKQSEAVLGCP